MTVNRVTTCCPECGHSAILTRQERCHRNGNKLHFACVNLYCGARFISELNYSHTTRVSRSVNVSRFSSPGHFIHTQSFRVSG